MGDSAMWRLIVVTFGFMAWGFYELSGGDEFEITKPENVAATAVKTETLEPAVNPAPVQTVATKPAKAKPTQETKVTLASLSVTKEDIPQATSNGFFVVLDNVKAQEIAPAVQVSTEAELSISPERDLELRVVTGNRVNMRNGPGKTHDVLARLTRGEEVQVLQDRGDGWVKLRVVSTNRVGWMADFLLASAE